MIQDVYFRSQITDMDFFPSRIQGSKRHRIRTRNILPTAVFSGNRIFCDKNSSDAVTSRILLLVFQAYCKSTPLKESIGKTSSFTRYVRKKSSFSLVLWVADLHLFGTDPNPGVGQKMRFRIPRLKNAELHKNENLLIFNYLNCAKSCET